MSLIMLSKHEPYPFLLDKYVAGYKVLVATPEDSLARDNELANNLYIELRVPKSEYKNEQVQEIVRWSRLPARDPHYYRDIAIHLIIMGGFERSIVFSHGRIRYETEADTEADFVTVKLLVRQKEDMYEGVVLGTDLEVAYDKSQEMFKPRLKAPAIVPLSYTGIGSNSSNEIDEEFNFVKVSADFPENKNITDIIDMVDNLDAADDYIESIYRDIPLSGTLYRLPGSVGYTLREINEIGYRSIHAEISSNYHREDFLCRKAIIKVKDVSKREERGFEGYLAYAYNSKVYEVCVIEYEAMLKFMDLKIMRPLLDSSRTVYSIAERKVTIPLVEYPVDPKQYLDNLRLRNIFKDLSSLIEIDDLDESKKTMPILTINENKKLADWTRDVEIPYKDSDFVIISGIKAIKPHNAVDGYVTIGYGHAIQSDEEAKKYGFITGKKQSVDEVSNSIRTQMGKYSSDGQNPAILTPDEAYRLLIEDLKSRRETATGFAADTGKEYSANEMDAMISLIYNGNKAYDPENLLYYLLAQDESGALNILRMADERGWYEGREGTLRRRLMEYNIFFNNDYEFFDSVEIDRLKKSIGF